MKRLYLYARVSKALDQNPETQFLQLRKWAENAQLDGEPVQILGERVDEISSRDTRPEKEFILNELRLGQADGVVVVALDRWGREMKELVLDFEQFYKNGWTLISLRESLNLGTAAGRVFAHLIAVFADFERDLIQERTNLGLARARAQGKTLGRPAKRGQEAEVMRLRAEHKTFREISEATGLSPATCMRISKSGVSKQQAVQTEEQVGFSGGVCETTPSEQPAIPL